MSNYLVNIPITRRDFDNTSSAKFKGNLEIVSNEYGVIYDWRINFSYVAIDRYFTAGWLDLPKLPSIYKYRVELFKRLGITQSPRPTQSSNDLVVLNQEQINIVNQFFNERPFEESLRGGYTSTIKMIVGILKGNNPGGEAKNPKSAEMIIDGNNLYKNFVILLDDLTMSGVRNLNAYKINAKEISLLEFSKLNPTLEAAFNLMQNAKDKVDFGIYLKNIKDYYKEYNGYINKADVIASQARAQYGKVIEQKIKQLPFGFESSKEFQKCHIYEFHILRDEIAKAMYEKKDYSKYVDAIKDPENFIPFPEHIHRQFDREAFTYTKDGKVYPVNEEGNEFVNKIMDDKFKQIPQFFLTPKRKEYLDKRNQLLNYLD